MKTDQLDYDLPPELIAQHPADERSASRLLVLDRSTGGLTDSRFNGVGDFLRPGDALALNDTKVLPARFFAHRQTGARLEGLFLGTAATPDLWQVMLKGARKVAGGETIVIENRQGGDFCAAELRAKEAGGRCLLYVDRAGTAEAVLEEIGFPPLPPYIRRDRQWPTAQQDRQRYQTVYAREPGAVAAPTAGLHFTDELIEQLKARGVRLASVTLHVGAGTFKPIATGEVEDHQIHRESYRVDRDNAEIINATRRQGGRIITVGTTVSRVLETVADDAGVHAGHGATDLFITPGYRFKAVDAMITNFHLPRSTLLALVAAFAGLENVLAAYRHAIDRQYRFYSYGDAMLIL